MTISTRELAERWGLHPESLKRAVRKGDCPVRPIMPSGKWRFSLPAIKRVEDNAVQ